MASPHPAITGVEFFSRHPALHRTEQQEVIRVQIFNPDRECFDVTDRLVEDGIGDLTENTEERFLELTHGDVEITLDNADGNVEHFFRTITPKDPFEIIIDVRRPQPVGPVWTRLFGGVLDLPWSLSYDRVDKTATMTVFSFSKLLEKVSGEDVKRVFTGITGSINAGEAVATLSSTVDMERGDILKFNDGTNEEEGTILIVSASNPDVTMEKVFTNAFAAGTPITVENSFHRWRPISFLAKELFNAAGIDAIDINIRHNIATTPFLTPASQRGLIQGGGGQLVLFPVLTIVNGIIRGISFPSLSIASETPDPRSPWVAISANPVGDWTPYLNVEPASLVDAGGIKGFNTQSGLGFKKDSTVADHVGNVRYQYQFLGGVNNTVKLLKATGTGNFSEIETVDQTTPETQFDLTAYIEVAPTTNDVWISYLNGTGATTQWEKTRVYDGSLPFIEVETALAGALHYLRRLDLIILHEQTKGASNAGDMTTNLHVYDPATRTKIRTVQVPATLDILQMRVLGPSNEIHGLYSNDGNTRVIVWDTDWNVLHDFIVSNVETGITTAFTYTKNATVTVWTEKDGTEIYYMQLPEGLFVLATFYAGVVPFANFEGLDAGAAMRELALLALAYIEVDHYKVGRLISRVFADPILKDQAPELPAPDEWSTMPVWEFYRTSAQIKAKTEGGTDIIVIAGDTGDAQHRIELESKLITSTTLAEAIALQVFSLFSQRPTQDEVKIRDVGLDLHVFGYVKLNGLIRFIIELSKSTRDLTYDLRLVDAEVT